MTENWQEDLLDFLRLAMTAEGVELAKIDAVIGTMTDTLANHFGDD